MDKSTKKRKKWNTAAVDILAARYGFSKYYIKEQIAGGRTPATADDIKKEYNQLVKQLQELSTKKNYELQDPI